MAHASRLPVDAFLTQHDGPLETFLREQVVANARVVHGRHQGKEDDDASFDVVLASRLVMRDGWKEEVVRYTAVLVKRWLGEEDEDDDDDAEEEESEREKDGGETANRWIWRVRGATNKTKWVRLGEEKERVNRANRQEPAVGSAGARSSPPFVDDDDDLPEGEVPAPGVPGGSPADGPRLNFVPHRPAWRLRPPPPPPPAAVGSEPPSVDSASESSDDTGEVSESKKEAGPQRRRVIQVGLQDCVSPMHALSSLAKEVFREAGDWLWGDRQEDLVRDMNILREQREKREAEEAERRSFAHDATAVISAWDRNAQ